MTKDRLDPFGNKLLPRMYYKAGRYYYVKRNKWTGLSSVYLRAVRQWTDLEDTQSGEWAALVNLVYEGYERRFNDGVLAEGTWKQYRGIKKKIVYGLALNAPHEITTTIVTQFLDQYETTPNIANRMLSVLRAVFEKGCRTGACDFNPTAGIKRFPEKKRDRYLTDAEFIAIRKHANPTIQVVMDIAYITAMRIGDILAIQHSHISDEGIELRQKKSGQRQFHRMTTELKRAVGDAKALHSIQTMSPYLLHPRGKKKAYSYRAIRDAYSRACDNAGVKDATIHDLRAKSLTDYDRGHDDAQKLAGHSSRAMTERYIRLRQTDVVSGPSLRNLIEAKGKSQ